MTLIPDLRSEEALILPWLINRISTCSATGATTYLTDTKEINSGVLMTDSQWNGLRVYLPAAGTATDRVRRVGGNNGNGLVFATGYLYPTVAWGSAPQSGDRYEIWTMDPQTAFNIAKSSLHRFNIPVTLPLTVLPDGDMESSGTTNHHIYASGGGAATGTITKVSTAGNVNLGRQSLFFNAGGVGEYYESDPVRVAEGQQYFQSCNIRVDAGGPFYFAIYDATNGAEIDSGSRLSTSHEGFRSLKRTFTPPSGCEEVTLRVYCTGSSDDAYINFFSGPWKASDRLFNTTSLITRASQIRKLLQAEYQYESPAGVRDATSRAYIERDRFSIDYVTRINTAAANPSRIELRPGSSMPLEEVFYEAVVRADSYYTLAFTAAGEAAPDVNIDKRLWAIAWAVDLCDHIISGGSADNAVRESKAEVEAELALLMADFEQNDAETPSLPPEMPLRTLGAN